MIITMVLIPKQHRIAGLGDMLGLGKGCHKTPGWIPITVNYQPEDWAMVINEPLDTSELSPADKQAIMDYCKRYAAEARQ